MIGSHVRRCAVAFGATFALAGAAFGCSGTGPSNPSGGGGAHGARSSVAAASPPKDDGDSAQGGAAGNMHAAALEQLKVAPLRGRVDKQQSVRIPMPDAEHWTRVRFWGVPSLVGFRYGKEHHAIVGGVVTHVGDNTARGACTKSFETWAMPWVQSFEVELAHEAPSAFVWTGPRSPTDQAGQSGQGGQTGKRRDIVDVDSVFAKTATLAEREAYAVAYSAYPAWKGACLIVGIAVPAREDEARAREVRDRFARDVLPKVEVLSDKEPKEAY